MVQVRLPFFGEVTTIGDDAFDGCRNLTSVTIPNYVPDDAVDAYQKADGWKELDNILSMSEKK